MISPKKINYINSKGYAAVILAESIGSLAIIRELGEQKVPCILVGSEFHQYSKYSTVFLQITSRTELIELLYKIPELLTAKLALFTDTDEYLDIILANFDELSSLYGIPASKKNKWLIDKEELAGFMNQHSFPIPKTYEQIEDISEQDYPVIIKPLWHDRKFSTMPFIPEKAYICYNDDQITKTINILKQSNLSYIIQQMIEGQTETIYTLLLYRGQSGNIEVGYEAKKIRSFPLNFGTASCMVTESIPDLAKRSAKIMELADYKGIAEFEYKYCSKTHEYYLIEVNGRFPLQTGLLHKWNPNFIYRSFVDLLEINQPKKMVVTEQKKSVYWVFLLNDIRAIKEETWWLIFSRYLKMLVSSPIQGALWSRKDPFPALFFIPSSLAKHGKRRLKSKFAIPSKM
ncbi:putative ATP-grasp superfamily ATP-dependent carboligase [Bacillus mesophilus]|uniref:ATP-grasp domain-containing protein n=1 Tax=Bacillus mesophilus TaxID=1808955 RepID=A0A6M0Q7I3_9BACI|nr:hypothetical protein [Bacillus mesophilus]MBM7661627.1 putative ATP-grasp superfamily ATP-dependent carboligase [Bacillus mesophilus]NEY72295.1 hypothetical protein [Bacillus mesophilus]